MWHTSMTPAGMRRHKARIFWGHREADAVLGGPCLELQRMAAVAGLSFWDPSSYLSLHPKYGPWFALRAVILFDGVDYTGEAQRQSPAPHPARGDHAGVVMECPAPPFWSALASPGCVQRKGGTCALSMAAW